MEILISAMLPIALVAAVGFGVGRNFDLDMQTLARVNIQGKRKKKGSVTC